MRSRPPFVIAAVLASASLAALLTAGPLDPPAGSITSTYKTLSEVEPRTAINATNTPGDAASVFRITQPGSYYLTQSLAGQSGKVCLSIEAANVTVDLMGFTIRGVAGATQGILSDSAAITIRNGSIADFAGGAILLGGPVSSKQHLVENIQVTGAGGIGIQLGPQSIARNCRVAGANTGINLEFGGLADRCVVAGNVNGIIVASGGTIAGCSASSNSQNGFFAEFSCTISDSTAFANRVGIFANQGCTITGCTVRDSQDDGVAAGDGCTITNCTSNANAGAGFRASAACRLSACTATGNAVGFDVGSSFLITGCNATANTSEGFTLAAAGRISDCTANGNTGPGIHANGGAFIQGNTCSFNAGNAGILAQGGDNRIESNTCASNGVGLQVLNPGNLVISNTCSGHTINFSIAAGNRYGPIINITNPATASATGDSAASTMLSTDPFANFAF